MGWASPCGHGFDAHTKDNGLVRSPETKPCSIEGGDCRYFERQLSKVLPNIVCVTKSNMKLSSQDLEKLAGLTLEHYNRQAEGHEAPTLVKRREFSPVAPMTKRPPSPHREP